MSEDEKENTKNKYPLKDDGEVSIQKTANPDDKFRKKTLDD